MHAEQVKGHADGDRARRLAEQPRGREHPACGTGARFRRRADDRAVVGRLGAALIIVRLLGDWNSPKPSPHTAIRQAMSRLSGDAPSRDSRNSPAAKIARPMPPSSPDDTLSASLPANGAAIPTAIGHGVISSPVANTLRPSTV